MRRTPLLVLSALATGSLTVMTSTSAWSAADTTPPALVTPVKSSFLVGSQMSTDYVPDCGTHVQGDGQVWNSLSQTFTWNATDATGPITYSYVQESPGFGEEDPVSLGTARSLTVLTGNSDQSCGGGNSNPSNWYVTARDGVGNATTKVVTGGRFTVTQQNNTTDPESVADAAQIAYGSGWSTAYCSCWGDGAVTKTSTRNATATITIPNRRDTSPTHLGLVMHKGPDRGRLQVLVNGRLNATVDLYAAANAPRTIVWQAALQKTDVVKVVNLATSGRPRIDLDAVLTN